jgi:hypothetical protein
VKTSQQINRNQQGGLPLQSPSSRYNSTFDRGSQHRVNWWQRIYQFFVGSNELSVWQTIDRLGQPVWHAYDPLTGASIICESEAEMVDWIETCYYNSRPGMALHRLERDQLMLL